MHKLKIQVQIAGNGFAAGKNQEMDRMIWNRGNALKNYIRERTTPVECSIPERKLAQGFSPHWAAKPTVSCNQQGDTL